MSVELRLPNITGVTEREQLAQIKSYLQQFVPQLQWALSAIDTSPTQNYTVLNDRTHKSQSTPSVQPDTNVLFSELKPLIIKSADIVQAYYEEINSRLESVYVAESDFGTYTEKTETLVRETSAFTEEMYSRLGTIEGTVGEILSRETTGYIKHGIIVDSLSAKEAEKYEKKEGDSLIGIEVGETIDGAFTKYARFTSDRLSFYDQNDDEVAYVGDYKLFIRNVEITSSYKIGGLEDTVMYNGDVVTKWVGGNG